MFKCFNAVFEVVNNAGGVRWFVFVKNLKVINIVDKGGVFSSDFVVDRCNVKIEENRAKNRTLWDTTVDL